MSDSPNKLTRFWQELKRRKVIYVITVYASAAFVIIELVNNVLEPLSLPENLSTIVIIALAIGFPIVVVLSWVFDMTPKGIEKTKSSDELKEGEKLATSNAWRFATYASLVVIIGLISLNIVSNNRVSQYLKLYGKSIAVLPFVNESPDKENEYFVNGTVDAIRNNLALLKDLKVVSRLSVEHYKAALIPIPEIAVEQEVAYILTGSMQKYGEQIRLMVLLYDANENLIWSRPYDREIREVEDRFSLQSEIAKLVSGEIKVIITPEEMQRIEKVPTTSIRANDFVNQADEEILIYARDWARVDALENAEAFYHKALSYDSSYAEAYAGIGAIYLFKFFWGGDQADDFMDSVQLMANIAYSFDKQLALSYTLRGNYNHYYLQNYDAALENYNKAIELNPNDPVAYEFKGYLLSSTNDYVGKIETTEELIKRERGPKNLPAYLLNLGTAYYEAGFPQIARQKYQDYLTYTGDSSRYYDKLSDIEFSIGNFKKVIELKIKAHEFGSDYRISVQNYILAGIQNEAYRAAQRVMEELRNGDWVSGVDRVYAAYSFWNAGELKDAEYLFNNYITDGEDYIRTHDNLGTLPWLNYVMAATYAFTGKKDNAYKSLDQFAKEKSIPLFRVTWFKNDPMFDSIRHEERFQKIIDIVEGKYQAEHERVEKWLKKTGRM